LLDVYFWIFKRAAFCKQIERLNVLQTMCFRDRSPHEFVKPATYSVTEQSFPGIVSTSSPVHHLDLRDVASKLSYQLYNQTALSSPSAADNLRSTGHVRSSTGR